MRLFIVAGILSTTVAIGCGSSKNDARELTEAPGGDMGQMTTEEAEYLQSEYDEHEQRIANQWVVVESHSHLTPAPSDANAVVLTGDNTRIDFLGTKPDGDKHAGGFGYLSGRLLFSNTLKLEQLTLKITTRSLWSDAPKLTAHLKNADFFNVNEYPEIICVSNEVIDNENGNYTIKADLELLGVKKEVSFPVLIGKTKQGTTLTSEFEFDRFRFGMNYGEGKIDKDVKMTVMVGTPAGPGPLPQPKPASDTADDDAGADEDAADADAADDVKAAADGDAPKDN